MERRRRVEAPGSTLVLPDVVPLPDLSFVEAVTTHERAVHAWPRPGTGPEFLSVREYRPGDSPRHVHWPSTARHGTVMVRELEEERTRRLAIVVELDLPAAGRRALPPGGVSRLAARLADAGARVHVWTVAEDLARCLGGGAVVGS
jgi:uncharacterized protein (DUF58 family)